MQRLALILLAFALAGPLGATAQSPDLLEMDGKTYRIHTNPLAPFLAANPGRLPKPAIISTGLWRGYIATWAVHENRLLLKDVRMLTKAAMDSKADESKRYRSVLKEMFGDGAPQPTAWFTGHLIVPMGELVDYVHMGYGSTYSSYLVLTIVQGELRERRKLSAEAFLKFRRTQYAAYRRTPEYAKARADATADGTKMPEAQLEDFLFQFTSEEYLSRIFR
ncbi:MAG TPA: hypothetical protein VFP80_04425 [Thermoanaerobaculia bacterium]|nr:hypothetical protein [Thermoanaerobaculia bacterium]